MDARTTGRASSTGTRLRTSRPTTKPAFRTNARLADSCVLKVGTTAGDAAAEAADTFNARGDFDIGLPDSLVGSLRHRPGNGFLTAGGGATRVSAQRRGAVRGMTRDRTLR